MQTVKLNLIPGSVLPVVNVSQYDENRQFALQVYEGATAYSLSGKSVQIRGTKPDGNGFAYDATDGVVSVSGSTVTISTTQQMTAVGGQTMAELRITSGDTILGTINFVLMVEPSALSDDTPISETDIPVIERQFQEALEEAQEAAETATTQAGIATTKAGEAATSATNAGNSATTASSAATTATTKAGEASTSATTASTAATAAAADSLEAEGWAVGEQGGAPVGPTSPYYQNNAAYYAAQAGQYATGGLIFKGSVAFANIPTTGIVNGDMYNITDDFTTDSRFIEGAGVAVKAGADIAYVAGSVNKWDILALGGGGASALDDLTDVSITSAADGDLLQYNGTSGEWENSNAVPQELAAMQEAGAVNIADITAESQVINGVTYTVDANKVIKLNGTASPGSTLTLFSNVVLPKGDYIVSYEVSNHNAAGLNGALYNRATGEWTSGYNLKNGVSKITLSANGTDAYNAQISVYNEFTVSNALVKFMIYDARLVNPPYQPFTMTNRELTDAVEVEEIDLSPYLYGTWEVGTGGFIKARRYGKVVNIVGRVLMNNTANQLLIAGSSLPTAYKFQDYKISSYATENNNGTISNAEVSYDGNLYLNKPLFQAWYTVGAKYYFDLTYIAK